MPSPKLPVALSRRKRTIMTRCAAKKLVLAFALLSPACSSTHESELDPSAVGSEKRLVTVASGEQIEITNDMICADTVSPLPPGTVAMPDAAGDSLILYREVDGGYAVVSSITCTCNVEQGGCSPFEGGGQSGCIMTSCSKCTKSGGEEEMALGGSSSPTVVIRPATDFVQTCGLITADYEKAYRDFLAKVYGADYEIDCEEETLAAEDRTWVLVDIGGLSTVTRLPTGALPPALAGVQVSEVGTSCSCSSGGDCPKKSKFPCGTICDATNCQSCTMSVVTDPPEK